MVFSKIYNTFSMIIPLILSLAMLCVMSGTSGGLKGIKKHIHSISSQN